MRSKTLTRSIVNDLKFFGSVAWNVIYGTIRYPTKTTVFYKGGRVVGHFSREELRQRDAEERRKSIEGLTENLMKTVYDPVVNDPSKRDEFRNYFREELMRSEIEF